MGQSRCFDRGQGVQSNYLNEHITRVRLFYTKELGPSYRQVPLKQSEKLGIYHVRRPVSWDRWILVMEMEAGKPTHVAYLLLIF